MVAFVSDGGHAAGVGEEPERGSVQITFGDRRRCARSGRRVEIASFSRSGDGIWSVATLGGDPRRIVEHGWNADLSPDGERLTFERSRGPWSRRLMERGSLR